MTFENVLEEFKEYLAEDTDCEVVLTKRGYTVMQWDKNSKSWYGVEYCETPKRLLEELTSAFREFESYKLTKGKSELSESDRTIIEEKCNSFLNLLQ